VTLTRAFPIATPVAAAMKRPCTVPVRVCCEGTSRLGRQLHWLRRMYGHTMLARASTDLHADEFVLPDVGRQFDQKSRIVVQSWCTARRARSPPTPTQCYIETSSSAPVAQRIEHPPPKRGAAGSIPAGRASLRSRDETCETAGRPPCVHFEALDGEKIFG
jgi:hypothetical protein